MYMYTLGCQPRYKVAMVVNTIKFLSKNFQESEFKFPVEKNSLVFDHQHGYHGVACNQHESEIWKVYWVKTVF